LLFVCSLTARIVMAQGTTLTGAFEGSVTESLHGTAVEGADVEIFNRDKPEVVYKRKTDSRGQFYQGSLEPGIYVIRVKKDGYQIRELLQPLKIQKVGEVVPVPVSLDPAGAGGTTPPAPNPPPVADVDIRAEINTTDARRDGSFGEDELTRLPLGGVTLVRTFDELALSLPGVAPPPQTLGGVTGPGVGAGVGSAGQFSVNGLRSRANNFTVDGSDNNDEDIGVRRQGFVALIPQPIESVKEYQVITLMAPAQYGRNLGAQVNAVSKSGGSQIHGNAYGFFNSSDLNARNYFDTTNGNGVTPLRTAAGQPVLLEGQPLTVRNQSGGKDSFTLGTAGGVIGGPIKSQRLFYFFSGEGQLVNATEEHSFAVPTVEQRGAFGSGATGIYRDPFTGAPTFSAPDSRNGSAIFSLFPFPNNPSGIYGANTFTEVLPADQRGLVLSGKLDGNFKIKERQQSATGRYNSTDDHRQIPVTGEALFSTLEPHIQTRNFSFFANSELSGPNSTTPIFNELRLSYGRTRLAFEEVRDTQFLIPSTRVANTPFLLNAREFFNNTVPSAAGVPNTGPVNFTRSALVAPGFEQTTELEFGPVGQVMIAGFNPLGVDVFNFPQRRVNNTYQIADVLNWRTRAHNLTFGTDNRRSELNSALPRNARTLVTFNGGPLLRFENGQFLPPSGTGPNQVLRPEDLAALGAPNGTLLTLATDREDGHIDLRFYQFNFFGQDVWRIRSKVSISYGLRYEYNTPPGESNRLIERTFSDPALALAPQLQQFIDGRTRIFQPDRNNFAPRISVAWMATPFGPDRITVIRGGFGMFYDQIPGAVVSQSRNVYPSFLTVNSGGILSTDRATELTLFNLAATTAQLADGRSASVVLPSTSNKLNPVIPLSYFVDSILPFFQASLGATLPARRLDMPEARHYTINVEQQLSRSLVVSAAYVGTDGRHLLRFTTPNLGPAATIVPVQFKHSNDGEFEVPALMGFYRTPSRPASGLGVINLFETTASSRYDSLQMQVRGRLHQSLQFQAAYTLSHSIDDVSDVFDLAGASALPQNSLTFSGERGSAGYDIRHRLAYNVIADFSGYGGKSVISRTLLSGLQLASTGQFQTGQPFTVNSIFDVNLDGNLTDRLNSTAGIIVTGDRRQPLRLATDDTFSLLAPFGQDGQVGRNTFRAGNVLQLDASLLKDFALASRQKIRLRIDFFNFINRANFGTPQRFLEAPQFGRATSTITPGRRIQFALKYEF
jgi:hypothetical protein